MGGIVEDSKDEVEIFTTYPYTQDVVGCKSFVALPGLQLLFRLCRPLILLRRKLLQLQLHHLQLASNFAIATQMGHLPHVYRVG